MNQKKLISAIILAKNEEKRIEACLQSVSWADERIVIDNGSTDQTVNIAKRLHAQVVQNASSDFSLLRNIAKNEATSTWLLYIDSDEIIPKDLKEEIIHEASSLKAASAYFIQRKNYYLGNIWPTSDKMIRLIKRDSLISWVGKLHEHPEIHGEIRTLAHPLLHDTHRTLEEMVSKTNAWSNTEAELRFKNHHPKMVWWRFFHVMIIGFWKSFIQEKGWKAGTAGLIESIYQAFSMFITYAKLWEKQK